MALVVVLSALVALSDGASFYQQWKDRLAEHPHPADAGLRFKRNFNMDLIDPGTSLRLQDFTGTGTFEVQTAGDSLSDDLYVFLKLEQQESNEDLKFKFTNRGIRGAVLDTYQHPTDTGVNITILWIGSNNIGSMESLEVISKILEAMRSYEEQGMICFVIGMPARFSERAGPNYLSESRTVNNILNLHLSHSGRFISLPSEAFVREAYISDLTHFTPEMYKVIAELVLRTMKEYIKTSGYSLPVWHPYGLFLTITSLLLLIYIIRECHQKSSKHIFVHLK